MKKVLPILGSVYFFIGSFFAVYFVTDLLPQPKLIFPIVILISISSYPFFRNERAFWRKVTHITFQNWVIDHLITGTVILALFLLGEYLVTK